MKYLWYGFLGLFSLGCLSLVAGAVVFIGILQYYGKDLPDYEQLKDYEPPIVTRLYAGDGRLMAEFATEKRVFMPIDKVPPLVKNAFIAVEDKNFYEHPGVDMLAIARAVVVYARHLLGQDVNIIGGSTITQQVVKNFLLSSERKFERKIKEAILATRMEKALSKDQILELYLNQIWFGYRSHGVTAAALQYFNKALDELSLAEIAYLAGLPKGPDNYHPIRKTEAAKKRRNFVISRMLEEEYITEAQADLAKLAPLQVIPRDKDKTVNAPYFAEEVRRELAEKYGEEVLYEGGLAVRSTIDPALQAIATRTLRDGLQAYDRRHGYRGALAQWETTDGWPDKLKDVQAPEGTLESWALAVVLETNPQGVRVGFADSTEGVITLEDLKWARKYKNQGYALGSSITKASQVLKKGDVVLAELKDAEDGHYHLRQVPDVQGSILALDPHTGRVLAMQGGWKYGSSEFNRATQAQRQPGSAFKPFVYLAALENNFTPATLVLDAPFVIEDRPGNFWSPTNYSNEYYGPTTLRVGVEKSRNLMTVRLADHLGMEMISDYARRFGITEDMPPLLANALGAGESTLLKVAGAYGVLVNGGKEITPTFLDRIQDRRGETIFRHDARECRNCGPLMKWKGQEAPALPDNRKQIADARASYLMTSILEGVVQRGTGAKIKSLGRPLAGKTGTTNDSKDAWFVGFSPDLVVGVYIGFDEPRSLGRRETGSSVAVPVFKDFMQDALENEPLTPFRVPPGIKNVRINAETGARAVPGDEKVMWESFIAGTEPTDQIFILDGEGISLMPTFTIEDIPGTPAVEATTGTGGLY